MDDFQPASAASAKARKLANKKFNSHPPTSSSSSKSSKKGGKPSTFLSTQPTPSPAAIQQDQEMMEFERLPLDSRSEEEIKAARQGQNSSNRVTDEQATAAMDLDQDQDSDNDADADADDSILIDPSSLSLPTPVTRTPISQIQGSNALSFPAVAHTSTSGLTQRRKVAIPPHRMTPLKRDWIKIYSPLVEECGLQVRMNMHKRWVEMKTSKHTPSPSSLTRASDFLTAYALGFAVDDAIALLRLEELYIESFEIKDIKTLHGDHLSRAIGRIAGHEGKTRFVIENASRTRIVLADTKIHILGTFSNIKIARDSISALVLGSPPGKIYANLRKVASRSRERF